MPGTFAVYLPCFILARSGSVFPHEWGFLQYLSLPPILAGAAIILRCVRDFWLIGRGTLAYFDPPKKLVVAGLYRYVRNPMYVGVFLMLAGETLHFKSVALLEYTAVWFVLIHLVVRFYEEPRLRRRFGESYDSYCRLVHRWLPGKPLAIDA